MEKKIRRSFWLVSLVFIVALAIMSTPTAAQKKVKLTYWTWWEPNPIFSEYLVEVGKDFAKKNPQCEGVEVVKIPFAGNEAKYLAAFMARKGAPDMFFGMTHDWAGTHDFADKMPEDLAKRVEEVALDKITGVFRGVRYGLPAEGAQFQMLFINTDMMKEAGLDPNKPPKDLQEFLEYAKKMTKYDATGKVVRAGFGIRYKGHPVGITDKFLPFLHAWDAVFVDPGYKKAVGVVNSKNAIDALTFYGDLVNKDKVTSLEFGNPEDAFSQKLAAMMTREPFGVAYVQKHGPDVKFKVFPLTAMKVAPGPWSLFPVAEMVYKHSPNKKLAWDFWRFFWTKEYDLERHKRQNLSPAWAANFDAPYMKERQDYDAIKEMLKRKIGPVYPHPKCSEVATAYGDSVLDVMYGRKNAETALMDAALRIERMLK
jgi:ABC-type glycerol-3-phosphate transport system substrate-binding protein